MAHVPREKFQGDQPIELGIAGLVDYAHTAGAEQFQNLVLRNGLGLVMNPLKGLAVTGSQWSD